MKVPCRKFTVENQVVIRRSLLATGKGLTVRSGLEDGFLLPAKPAFPPSMAVKSDAKLRTGEGLNLKISEEPVQLNF